MKDVGINIAELTESDVGRWVRYWPNDEIGRIKSWGTSLVHVVYKCNEDWDNFENYTSAATHPKALGFIERPEGKGGE